MWSRKGEWRERESEIPKDGKPTNKYDAMLDAVMPALLQNRRRSGRESDDAGITRRSKKSRIVWVEKTNRVTTTTMVTLTIH